MAKVIACNFFTIYVFVEYMCSVQKSKIMAKVKDDMDSHPRHSLLPAPKTFSTKFGPVVTSPDVMHSGRSFESGKGHPHGAGDGMRSVDSEGPSPKHGIFIPHHRVQPVSVAASEAVSKKSGNGVGSLQPKSQSIRSPSPERNTRLPQLKSRTLSPDRAKAGVGSSKLTALKLRGAETSEISNEMNSEKGTKVTSTIATDANNKQDAPGSDVMSSSTTSEESSGNATNLAYRSKLVRPRSSATSASHNDNAIGTKESRKLQKPSKVVKPGKAVASLKRGGASQESEDPKDQKDLLPKSNGVDIAKKSKMSSKTIATKVHSGEVGMPGKPLNRHHASDERGLSRIESKSIHGLANLSCRSVDAGGALKNMNLTFVKCGAEASESSRSSPCSSSAPMPDLLTPSAFYSKIPRLDSNDEDSTTEQEFLTTSQGSLASSLGILNESDMSALDSSFLPMNLAKGVDVRSDSASIGDSDLDMLSMTITAPPDRTYSCGGTTEMVDIDEDKCSMPSSVSDSRSKSSDGSKIGRGSVVVSQSSCWENDNISLDAESPFIDYADIRNSNCSDNMACDVILSSKKTMSDTEFDDGRTDDAKSYVGLSTDLCGIQRSGTNINTAESERLMADLLAGHCKADRPTSMISTGSTDTGIVADTSMFRRSLNEGERRERPLSLISTSSQDTGQH